MRRIQKGNDIRIRWTINRNGSPEEFVGKDIKVSLVTEYRKEIPSTFSIDGNVISITFLGKDQEFNGRYLLLLVENYGKEGMTTLDHCDAFELVPSSCYIGGETCSNIEIQTLEVTDDIALPANGLSAYEIAVKNGFVGTELEWLASLKGDKGDAFTYEDFTQEQLDEIKKPGVDAANVAIEAAKNANQAATDANESRRNIESNESARIKDEETRRLNEEKRVEAESLRDTEEGNRVEAESNRVTEFGTLKQDTSDAIANANNAASNANTAVESVNIAIGNVDTAIKNVNSTNQAIADAEALRVKAEEGRVSAEDARGTAEDTRVSNESNRVTAESNRETAEGNRASAETTRSKDEAMRVQNETDRGTAEGNRVTAENDRVTEEGKRVTAEENRVREFGRLKGESETATNAANKAASTANTKITELANYDTRVANVETKNNEQDGKLSALDLKVGQNGKVSAASLNDVNNKLMQIQRLIDALLRGDAYLEKITLKELYFEGAPLLVVGDGTPSDVPDFIGQEYIDKTGKVGYKAVGDGRVSDWKQTTL